jgi:hypothetical protein
MGVGRADTRRGGKRGGASRKMGLATKRGEISYGVEKGLEQRMGELDWGARGSGAKADARNGDAAALATGEDAAGWRSEQGTDVVAKLEARAWGSEWRGWCALLLGGEGGWKMSTGERRRRDKETAGLKMDT